MSPNEDFLLDKEAYNLQTTDAKRLHRMYWEDILHMMEGSDIIVYFHKNMDHNLFDNLPKDAANQQPDSTEDG